MAFNTKYIELCGINPLKSSKRTGNTFFSVVLLSKVHCTQSTLCRLCTGYFSFSCPVIFCCNNWIWNPCGGIVSSGLFQKSSVTVCISDLMRRWAYWWHIKQPLGSCALAVSARFVWCYWLKMSLWLHALSCLTHINYCCLILFLAGCSRSRQKGESECESDFNIKVRSAHTVHF